MGRRLAKKIHPGGGLPGFYQPPDGLAKNAETLEGLQPSEKNDMPGIMRRRRIFIYGEAEARDISFATPLSLLEPCIARRAPFGQSARRLQSIWNPCRD